MFLKNNYSFVNNICKCDDNTLVVHLRLGDIINNGDHSIAISEIKLLTQKLGKIAAASKVKSSLSKVRKELKKKNPKLEKALKSYNKSLDNYYEMKDNLLETKDALPELQSYRTNLGNLISINLNFFTFLF